MWIFTLPQFCSEYATLNVTVSHPYQACWGSGEEKDRGWLLPSLAMEAGWLISPKCLGLRVGEGRARSGEYSFAVRNHLSGRN